MSTVLVMQHHPVENLGTIEQALTARGMKAEYVHSYAGQPVPGDMEGYAGLVLMGGPMGVYESDRYPWLEDEMRLAERALKAELPVLGVCLGSQLLAAVLGSHVRKGEAPEIGWYEVRLSGLAAGDPLWKEAAAAGGRFQAFHWHGDIFDLPEGARPLASSAQTKCQAFVYGPGAYGLLFHMEVTEKGAADMITSFEEEARAAGLEAADLLEETPGRLPDLHRVGGPVYRNWAGLAAGR